MTNKNLKDEYYSHPTAELGEKDIVLHSTFHKKLKDGEGFWRAFFFKGDTSRFVCLHYCDYPPNEQTRATMVFCKDCRGYFCARCNAEAPQECITPAWFVGDVLKRVCMKCSQKRAWHPSYPY